MINVRLCGRIIAGVLVIVTISFFFGLTLFLFLAGLTFLRVALTGG